MNTAKTFLLLGALTVLFVLMGRWIGGETGMVIAFALALVMNGVSYWYSDKIVLRMYGAQPLSPAEAPQLYRRVERLAANAGLPMPKLYVIGDASPNAFATGRDPQHAAVAVTQGLLQLLNSEEVAGVVAHELAHVKNRDTLISTVAAAMAGAITLLAQWAQMLSFYGGYGYGDQEERGGNPLGMLLMAILAPIAALLIQMAISRSREYAADAEGARICGQPLALADAVRKLEIAAHRRPMHASEATAHMFIVNPLVGGLGNLFSTHPPTADRIARLEEMAGAHSPAYAWR